LAQLTGLNYISISELAKENNFYLNYDSELDSYELDEDQVIDEIDEIMKEGKLLCLILTNKMIK
jgi:broad-specificity NMP kinase